MDGLPEFLFTDFTNLKKKNPALKTVIALGGWTFNDPGMLCAPLSELLRPARSLKPKPGPTQKVFSDMTASKASRTAFIGNLMSFLRQYAFDGVDFDWVSFDIPNL
jgi:chitinase